MKILKNFSKLFIAESDKAYWDKKATVLEWQKQTGKKLSPDSTNQAIYESAIKDGYNVSWKTLSDGLPDYFIELSQLDVTFAISIGILTAFTAMLVDRIGSEKSEKETGIKSLEKRISEMAEKGYDKNNPFDLRSGANHRKVGHDFFSFNKDIIPGEYIMRDKSGNLRKVADIVGSSTKEKFSMSDLINATYGTNTNNFFSGIWDKIAHTIHHLAKDIVTPNGLPLPFTELLNKFSEANNVSGYKVTNELLDNVQNEFVSLRASDFTSVGFIRLTHSVLYRIKETEWKNFDKNTISATKAQLNVLSYCSCVITQMFLYLFKKENLYTLVDRKTNEDDGGTLNWIMLSLIIKNVAQVFYYQSKMNKFLLDEQQQIIDELIKEENTYGETVQV
ncbi:hypothetical protein SAMN05216470_1217 [Streptococcus equinus]|uniref:Uncharacterized protein n=1 Tax=Streptococcus equinus TaxID=1335 RepID=A0A239RCK8_STREI|nr:hypothetical protein [Streptococcus equinus]SNU08324.1 hypothetical protein SAMN05216470_1217 [Streptococcus equinus]